ncbi:MAG: pyruvate dehydrogenase (acetyl-transferring) E1 component subunit alpha [Bacteroidales bacterium]|nr:pyruvate dehydrogenase (acetyl-transferring) E1 component subunit alpha [Bacteroidales bacterium]
MFKEYNPLDDKLFQVIDKDGKILAKKHMPDISDERVIQAFNDMLFARTADMMAVSYQRQGRMFTYPPNFGQEAISGGLAVVMRDQDWLVPAFRELGAWLAKGASLKEIFLYFMGYEDGTVFKDAKNITPIAVPIASQLLHAVGIGYAIKYRKLDSVVYAIVGDGGTSTGDFHEALNFAAVWDAPVVFIVQNNQFAISVPFKKQTRSINIAVKGIAYGMECIKVDGNDLFAMVKALQEAAKLAGEGKPVLIEALTYRRGAHTTSDDPTKYRTKEEEETWALADPIDRLRKYLVSKKLWNEDSEEALLAQFKKEIDRQFEEAENYPAYALDDVFKFHYADMPADLRRQQVEYEKFLQWKEARK